MVKQISKKNPCFNVSSLNLQSLCCCFYLFYGVTLSLLFALLSFPPFNRDKGGVTLIKVKILLFSWKSFGFGDSFCLFIVSKSKLILDHDTHTHTSGRKEEREGETKKTMKDERWIGTISVNKDLSCPYWAVNNGTRNETCFAVPPTVNYDYGLGQASQRRLFYSNHEQTLQLLRGRKVFSWLNARKEVLRSRLLAPL